MKAVINDKIDFNKYSDFELGMDDEVKKNTLQEIQDTMNTLIDRFPTTAACNELLQDAFQNLISGMSDGPWLALDHAPIITMFLNDDIYFSCDIIEDILDNVREQVPDIPKVDLINWVDTFRNIANGIEEIIKKEYN